MIKIKEQFGQKLKKLRLLANLSQEQLAEKLEISTVSLSSIENGKTFVKYNNLEKICSIFNITPVSLFNFKDEPIKNNDQCILDDNLKTFEPTKISNIKRLLGKNIQKFRENADLSQRELAKLIDVQIGTICQIERGKRFVSEKTLIGICNVLSCSLIELFDFSSVSQNEIDQLNSIIIKLKQNPKLIKVIYNIIPALLK